MAGGLSLSSFNDPNVDSDYLSQIQGYQDGTRDDDEEAPSGGLPSTTTKITPMNMTGITEMSQHADDHLQQVINGLIQKQSQPSRAEMMAAWSGGQPGQRTAFGDSMVQGLAARAPITAARDNKLDELRMKAAELESNRQKALIQAQVQASYRADNRSDRLAKMGLKLDDSGQYVVDPQLFDSQVKLAQAKAYPVPAGWNAQPPTGAPAGAQPNADGTSTTITPMSGEAYLKSLPPEQQTMVQALVEGRYPTPTQRMMNSPMWQQATEAAMKVDPTFDAGNYPGRVQARKSLMPGGKDYASLQALNTVAGHLQKFSDSADALNNTASPDWNKLANAFESHTGDPRVKNFNLTRSAVSDELSKAYKGGVISDTEKKEWSENLDNASSPEQFQGAVKTMADLLQSKINAMKSGAQAALGSGVSKIQFINPEAQKLFDKFEGKTDSEATPDKSGAFQPTYMTNPDKPGKRVLIKSKSDYDDASKKGWVSK